MKQSWGKIRYGWSKYGGPMYGVIRSEGEWHCQACGESQPHGVGEYMLPINPTFRDFVRVCTVCKHIQLRKKMSYYRLIKFVRKTYG